MLEGPLGRGLISSLVTQITWREIGVTSLPSPMSASIFIALQSSLNCENEGSPGIE